MNATRTLMLAALLLPGLALAHHHHFHHHDWDSHHETELVCVRWEADVTAVAVGVQDADAGSCGCEVPVTDAETADAGSDAGTALETEAHAGEHCVQWEPAVGCSTGAGLMPFAGALLRLVRRRSRRA